MVKLNIVWFLMTYQYLSFQDIQNLVKRSKGTIHFHLKNLLEAKMIKEIQIDNPKHGNMKYYSLNFDYRFSINDVSNEKEENKENYIYSMFKQGIYNIKLAEKKLENTRKQFESIIDKYEESKKEDNKDICQQLIKKIETIMDVSTISFFPLTEDKFLLYKKALEKILADILNDSKMKYDSTEKQIYSIISIGMPTFII